MEAKAILRNARIAPRKVQIVLDLIRGKDYDVAMATVKHTPKAASEYLEKLLKSAAHNAEKTITWIRTTFTLQSAMFVQDR